VVDVVTDQLRTPAAASAATAVMALGALVALRALVALVALGALVAVVTATVATPASPATRAAATGWWCYAAGRDALLELLQFEIQMFHSLSPPFCLGFSS